MKRKALFAALFIGFVWAAFGQSEGDAVSDLPAPEEPKKPTLSVIIIYDSQNSYYTFYYKDFKPDDVSQEVYDGLWEVQLEVIDNFTYDYAAMRDSRKYRNLTTKEEFYEHGKGVCENYTNFFILLAREKNMTENLYKVSGGNHAWLEYHTENNVYIIDPTWSDDYSIHDKKARQEFKESRAYGRRSFFITFAEDKIIYRKQGYNHSSISRKNKEIPLWDKEE